MILWESSTMRALQIWTSNAYSALFVMVQKAKTGWRPKNDEICSSKTFSIKYAPVSSNADKKMCARWGHRSIYCNSGVTHRVRVLQTNWPVLYVISFSSGAEAIHPTSQRSLGWEEGPRRHGACQRGPREQAGRVCPKKLICQLHLALWTQDPYHHGWTTGEWPSFDSFFFFLSMTLSPLLSVLQHHKHAFWPSYFIMLVIGTLDDSVYWLDIFMQSTVSNLF